ncbi:MAG TPA: LLM class F420-dependent oxidoreductase [Methylomirabilota bacterium]|nr:LLM class F420-dependent oxidoreductase [Methylomirabilota bacterium]
MRGMHFGVSLPGRGPLATPEVLTKLAEKADSLRYSSIFVTDHVVIPTTSNSTYPYSPTGRFATEWTNGYLEPIAMMGVLVGLTSRVKIGTSVLVVPYRNPVVTAKMLATLDVMSGGRLILGAGVGWMREEFEAVQAPAFEERGRSTDEYLRLMRVMWTKEPAEFTGKYYRLPSVSALPKPRQAGGIPIWVGGHTDAALRRAGELADGWHPIGMRPPALLHPPEYAQMVKVIHGWARKAGRDPKNITLSLRVPLELAPRRGAWTGGDQPGFRGTAAQVIAHIKAYQALGVSHFVFDLAPSDLRGQLLLMERFVQEVRPKVLRAPR